MENDPNLVPDRPWMQARQQNAEVNAEEVARAKQRADAKSKRFWYKVLIWFFVILATVLAIGIPAGWFVTDPCAAARSDYGMFKVYSSSGDFDAASGAWDDYLSHDAACRAKQ